MKKLFLLSLMIGALITFSCNSNTSSNATTNSDSTKVDSAMQTHKTDTMMNNGNPTDTSQSAVPEKPSVPQLTFCDCIRKQDTLNKALMNAETSKEMKDIQKKMKALVNGPCRKFLTGQFSKDQVAERKQKVAACLGK